MRRIKQGESKEHAHIGKQKQKKKRKKKTFGGCKISLYTYAPCDKQQTSPVREKQNVYTKGNMRAK